MPSISEVDVAHERAIYLDVEFTNFESPELLSLGMVTAAGAEFYCELDQRQPGNAGTFKRCSDFVNDTVLPQWGRVPPSFDHAVMGACAWGWLAQQQRQLATDPREPVSRLHIVHDHAIDFELLKRLLVKCEAWSWLIGLLEPADISELMTRFDPALAYDSAFQRLLSRDLHRHHALADALALRAAVHPMFAPRGGAQ